MPVTRACELLKVSRSGYYEFLKRRKSRRQIEREAMEPFILSIFEENKGRYGSRRVAGALREMGIVANRKRVQRVMSSMGLIALGSSKKPRHRRGKVSEDGLNRLDRKFDVEERNRAWVGDITYIPTKEGWLYLSAFMDLFSRKIVGWASGPRMTEDLVIRSLDQAVSRESPDSGLVVHSDRGSQYTSARFSLALRDKGFFQSFSHKGTPYDNAPMESFFKTLKRELPLTGPFPTRLEARQEIFKYIELYYNTKRAHSKLGGLSPICYERANGH